MGKIDTRSEQRTNKPKVFMKKTALINDNQSSLAISRYRGLNRNIKKTAILKKITINYQRQIITLYHVILQAQEIIEEDLQSFKFS